MVANAHIAKAATASPVSRIMEMSDRILEPILELIKILKFLTQNNTTKIGNENALPIV